MSAATAYQGRATVSVDFVCPEHGTTWVGGVPCNRCMRADLDDDSLERIEQVERPRTVGIARRA